MIFRPFGAKKNKKIGYGKFSIMDFFLNPSLRRTVKANAPLRVQLLLTFGGRGGEKSKKLGGREGCIESQQKFDFFKYGITP